MRQRILIGTFILITLFGCAKSTPPVTIAINPWPGFEFLYLAEQRGFFKEVGANIELVQLASLSDAQRAYISGRVDGMTSTLIEAIQAQTLSNRPLSAVLVADYSDGGDVIIGRAGINSIADLKNKTVGCEVSSLGIFLLSRALDKAGLSLSEVSIINTEQLEGVEALKSGAISAFVTYPPESIKAQRVNGAKTIFSSAEIPSEVIDLVVISNQVLKQQPDLPMKIRQAWQMALDEFDAQPEQAITLMAEREGISPEDFKAALGDLKIFSGKDQNKLFTEYEKLNTTSESVCETLVGSGALITDCKKLTPIFNAL